MTINFISRTRLARLPVVRHIRYFIWLRRVNRYYYFWLHGMGMLPVRSRLDYDTLDRIWRGEI